MNTSNRSGFTLLEILVSATVIAVLAAIAITSYTSINKRGRDAKRKSDIEQIRSALEMYRADNGFYPSTGDGGWITVSNFSGVLTTTYMPTIPADPSPATYAYQYKATNFSSGQYYGYCLSAYIETENVANSCTYTGYTYGVSHP